MKKIIVFILTMFVLIPMVSAGVTDTGSDQIKRETKTNYFTKISFKGEVTDTKTGNKETFTKESSEIAGNYSDTSVKNEVNKLKNEFIKWAKEKGAISFSAGENGVTDYYYDAHDEITQSNETSNINITTVLDKHQTYVVNYSAKIEDVKFTKGANGKHTLDTNKTLGFTLNVDYSLFKDGGKVLVNGKALSSKDYSSKSGSTIITLKSGYLNTLESGKYTLKVELNNGLSAQTNFSIISNVTEPVVEEPIEEPIEEPPITPEPIAEEPTEDSPTEVVSENNSSNTGLLIGVISGIVVLIIVAILIIRNKKNNKVS